MNEYEMMTVFHPRLNADETTAAISGLEEQIVANGGEMLSTDNWGRRRLAYPINGVVDGKPLKDLKVDKVAGASWTSEAFNKALDVARQEASIQ